MCNAIRNIWRSAVDCVDKCSIRINRCTPSVRKTIALTAIFYAPIAVINGAWIAYGNYSSKLEAVLVVWNVAFSTAVTVGSLYGRYGWVARPGFRFLPPEPIRALLRAELDNDALPETYRSETRELLNEISERERSTRRDMEDYLARLQAERLLNGVMA